MSWKTIKSTKKTDFPLFKTFEDIVELPNGHQLNYYRVEKIPVTIILPVLSDKIVMVRQYRYPIDSDSLELPAGHVKSGETPEECAIRELKEETGFSAGKMEKILEYNPSTEYSSQVYHIFLADDLEEGEPDREKYEILDVEVLNPELIIEKILNGDITDGRTITSIFLAKHLNKI
jgi:ADP-ribose pyrophosphatase